MIFFITEKNANETTISQYDSLKNDLSCVKYEAKKFKEQTVPAVAPIQELTAEAPVIPDDLLDRLAAEENNSNETKDLDNQTQEQTNSICQKTK